jgi:ElaB/YqjD/DUF883 family membrane-anchored ribosome-binding protein
VLAKRPVARDSESIAFFPESPKIIRDHSGFNIGRIGVGLLKLNCPVPTLGGLIMAQQVFSSLGETADRKLHELADSSRQKLEEIKKKNLEDLYSETKGWMSNNPGKTLMGAAATGFLLGVLFRRR